MNRKPKVSYEQLNKIEDDLSEEISNLKFVSQGINRQLRAECTCYFIFRENTGGTGVLYRRRH